MNSFFLLRRVLLGATGVLFCTVAAMAAFPDKPIRMIVISSAGGSTDMVARATGRALGEGLGQTVVLDNRPGGGGVIASDLTAKARPDGYTILMSNTSHAVQPSLHAKLPYDPLKDFAPVSLVALTHSLLLTHPSLPVKTVRELIDYAKTNPGKLNYASGTNGSSAHIGSELLKLMAGIDIVRVPYKGTAENLNALLANEVQVSFVTLPAALPLISFGRLRVLLSYALPNALLPTLTVTGSHFVLLVGGTVLVASHACPMCQRWRKHSPAMTSGPGMVFLHRPALRQRSSRA